MLDRYKRQARGFRSAGRDEIRMEIADRPFGLDLEDRGQMPDRLVAEADGLAVVEIADVLRDEGLSAAGDRDRILEIGARGDHARAVEAEIDRVRNETARAPDIGGGPVDNAHDGIVGPDDDGALVADDQVGDARKTPFRVCI